MVLAAVSEWIGDAVPKADNPALRPILYLSHHGFRWENPPCILWVFGPIPRDFTSIGNIAPTSAEEKVVNDSPVGFAHWTYLTFQPLHQWRWDNDREAVLAEDAAR
ncbi:MAG: hypothetical protein ABSH22_23120, partial [Tepidisphaeraceae bacterium]